MPKTMTAEEKKWQASDDARAMKRYAEVAADNDRLEAAKKHIEEEMKNLQGVMQFSFHGVRPNPNQGG